MNTDPIALLLPVMFVALCVWMVYTVHRGRRSIRTGDENTQAVRENSELLRELIALNRQILNTEQRSDS
jgi:hypothetical protein